MGTPWSGVHGPSIAGAYHRGVQLHQLRYFATVAETRHFTRAAELLHVAQPSLSQQIRALERELGADLFHRARGNIALTDAGEALLPLARQILADAETAHREVQEVASFGAAGCGWGPRRACAPASSPMCCAASMTSFPASS